MSELRQSQEKRRNVDRPYRRIAVGMLAVAMIGIAIPAPAQALPQECLDAINAFEVALDWTFEETLEDSLNALFAHDLAWSQSFEDEVENIIDNCNVSYDGECSYVGGVPLKCAAPHAHMNVVPSFPCEGGYDDDKACYQPEWSGWCLTWTGGNCLISGSTSVAGFFPYSARQIASPGQPAIFDPFGLEKTDSYPYSTQPCAITTVTVVDPLPLPGTQNDTGCWP